ncbi:sensor histidine kinase [Gordonia humi]|uniref:ATP-binding protein n=1 Tax=Gordonia humi TaxID=686429 RepID=A0A840EYD4_9ACTN|nr:ATP-binding protein [Gordonia humi]MBB4135293.1 hypothetical protein [Gordonia humi]
MLNDPEHSPSSRLGDRIMGDLRNRSRAHTSTQTVQSVGAGILGGAYLVYLVTATGSFTDFGRLVDPWWLPISAVVVVLSGFALLAVAFTGRIDRLFPAGAMCAVGYLAMMGLWFLAWNGAATDVDGRSPTIVVWFTMLPELASLALVLAERPVLAAGNFVVSGILGEAVASVGRTGAYGDLESAMRTLWSLSWGGIFLAMGVTAVAFARRLDDTRSTTVETVRDRAREDTRGIEQRRLDSLVHDRIIALLLALRPGSPEPETVASAASVLDELDHWWDRATDADSDGREFVERLRATVVLLGDRVAVRAELSAAPATRFPFEVTEAILDAVAEAVRNYHRHAGEGADCLVIAVIDDDSIAVTVVDDGVGFDPDAIPLGRLGLSFGITGRLDSVPGGTSSVLSAMGQGVRVHVGWERP